MIRISGKEQEVEDFLNSNSIDKSKVKINIKESIWLSLIPLFCGLIGSKLIVLFQEYTSNTILSNALGILVAFVLWQIGSIIYKRYKED
jgi:hypothetical protein